MKSFNTHISNINESIVDTPRSTYSRDIFDAAETEEPTMKPEVKEFIENGLKQFETIARVKKYQLIGSILTHNYRDDADLDISVLFHTDNLDDQQKEFLQKELNERAVIINGSVVPGTEHPVNYYALLDENVYNTSAETAEAVFDIKDNHFIRKENKVGLNLDDYIEKFRSLVGEIDIIKGELKRDLIDYKELSKFSESDVESLKEKLQQKLKEIQEDIQQLIQLYVKTKEDRNEIFTRPMTPEEIRRYGQKNRLPENVLYKMLERYHYLILLKALKDFYKHNIQDVEISEQIIAEATAEEIHIKYYSKIPKEIFDELYKLDPTSKDNKLGEYSKWILNIYNKLTAVTQKNRFVEEDGYKITNALERYNKAKKANKIDKKDINVFKTHNELIDYLDTKNIKSVEDVKSKAEIDKEIKEAGAKKVFEDDDWYVVVPETHDAACKYGAGTQWCTASKSSNYYDKYTHDGPLYIIISKKERDAADRPVKYQFHFQSNQFMDAKDRSIASTSAEAKEWISDEMGEAAREFFDSVYSSFAERVDQKGYDDPEIKKEAEKIVSKKYAKYSRDNEYYEYDFNRDMESVITSLPYEAPTSELMDLYHRIESYKLGENEDDVNALIIQSLREDIPQELKAALIKYYELNRKDFLSYDELQDHLYDEKILADDKLMVELQNVYKDVANNELAAQAKDLFIDELYSVLGSTYIRQNSYADEESQFNLDLRLFDGNGKPVDTKMTVSELVDATNIVSVFDGSNLVDLAMILDSDDWDVSSYYDDSEFRDKLKDLDLPEVNFTQIRSKAIQAINNFLGKGSVEHEKQLALDLSHRIPLKFKNFLNEVHYRDYFHENFDVFRKKYLKFLKKNATEAKDLYVNFTNHTSDMIDKTFSLSPDHRDPIGLYGYPLEYVLKYPADIWYGANAKYLRILKHEKKQMTCYLQEISENSVIRNIGKIYDIGWGEANEVYSQTLKWLRKWGRANTVSEGAIFFFNIQHNMMAEPEYKEDGWSSSKEKPLYPERKPLEQSKLLLKMGYLSIVDSARTGRKAIINDREPEQIIFLRRDAFDTVETITMNQKSDYVATSKDPTKVERKLVADLAGVMGDKITEGPERSGLGGWSFYWTKNGRRIGVDFEWSSEYFEKMQATRKMGEKKHKEYKLSDMKQIAIQVQTEYGPIEFTYEPDSEFSEIVKDFEKDWEDIQKKEKSAVWKSENKTEFLKKKEIEKTLAYYKQWFKDFVPGKWNDHADDRGYRIETEEELKKHLISKNPELKDDIERVYKEAMGL